MNSTATILLVEDNEDDIFFVKRAMAAAEIGNPVQVVRDGQAAIDYISGQDGYRDREQFPMPYLVLLDLKLPHKGGLEVLRSIRADPRHSGIVIVVMTTSRERTDISQAYRLGANAFLVKPTSPPQLVEMMKALKSFWITQNTSGEG